MQFLIIQGLTASLLAAGWVSAFVGFSLISGLIACELTHGAFFMLVTYFGATRYAL